ncbi:F0F1 ATP synthase subunit epsilon [Candidatus Bodocaedibacter vickermanii]|uniref:ATP synthase epsilon chain n=1 Tax=Candidatus Bodocaedibacter vickermanii TaxID=2741701 RepID=A0A7L9RUV1_9PROT|nr:ATP synthase epsilon chain [Candidatus Paracaedibacteraceae bacterium 'Lake Konstanz']
MRFFLKVLAPDLELFQDHVDSVQVPATDGAYELLSNHASIFIALQAGALIVRQSDETERWFINGGTCHMHDNHCIITVKSVIDMDKIDKESIMTELNKNNDSIVSSEKRQLLEAQLAYKSTL